MFMIGLNPCHGRGHDPAFRGQNLSTPQYGTVRFPFRSETALGS